MSGFSRSLKSPSSYLSPYRRPHMPGRTFSNSSDLSLTSEDGIEQHHQRSPVSGRSTPIHQAYQTRRYGPPGMTTTNAGSGATTGAAAASNKTNTAPTVANDLAPTIQEPPASASASYSTGCSSSLYTPPSSRPIAIEAPRVHRIGSAPVYTPPPFEPLSARGDRAGGYFPLHEDPKARIYRPHPFHHEPKANSCNTSAVPASDPDGLVWDRKTAASRPVQNNGAMSTSIPVASYFPSGYHDNPLPMGKYYPSNYENAHSQSSRSVASPSTPGRPRSPKCAGPTSPAQSIGSAEPELRRKLQLQQYQRDMMAQASRAANDLMAEPNGPKSNSGRLSLKNLPGMDKRFNSTPMMHKPNAPRLHPLGSPGPVTPMELESSSSGGSYLDKGTGKDARPGQPGKSYTTNSI